MHQLRSAHKIGKKITSIYLADGNSKTKSHVMFGHYDEDAWLASSENIYKSIEVLTLSATSWEVKADYIGGHVKSGYSGGGWSTLNQKLIIDPAFPFIYYPIEKFKQYQNYAKELKESVVIDKAIYFNKKCSQVLTDNTGELSVLVGLSAR